MSDKERDDIQELFRLVSELAGTVNGNHKVQVSKLDGITYRLGVSNGRIGKNEIGIIDQGKEIAALRAVIEGRAGEIAYKRKVNLTLLERGLWVAGGLITALLTWFLSTN